MIPITKVKKDLAYTQDLSDIIDVIKLIASSEFSSLYSRMPKEDELKGEIINCFELLVPVAGTNLFFVERKGLPMAFLLVCSDEGFLGEVNTVVADAALSRGLAGGAKFIVLGERGAAILKDSGVGFTTFPSIGNEMNRAHVVQIANYIMEQYKTKKIGGFYVIYMKFLSFTAHRIGITKLLPCDEIINYAREKREREYFEVLFEPHPYYVVEYLVKLWLETNLYNILWSSKLSEWSIRVMQLEHSSDELKDMNKDLTFKYFKSLHSLNDKVIREIFAARTLL